MTDITTTVELKKPLYFIDGSLFQPMAKTNSALSTVNAWEDYSADVVVSKGFSHSRGINGNKPTSLVASPGKLTLMLNNSALNSGSKAGYYSLEHSNVRDGFEQGAEIRVKYVYSTSTGYRWRGKIYDITPDTSPYKAFTKVVAYDWMKIAQEQKFKSIEVATDQTGDEAITTLLGILPVSRQPATTA